MELCRATVMAGEHRYLEPSRRSASSCVARINLRMALDPVALVLSPFVAFAIYLILRSRYPLASEHWTRGRVSTLTLVGLAIAVAGMFVFGLSAPRGHGA